MNLKNKIVIITGAGSGIGAACAKKFASLDATVIISDIVFDHAQRTALEISQAGHAATATQTDVSKHEEVKHLIEETVKDYGRLDIIVNNAGIGPSQMVKTAEHSLEDWDNVIAVNQTGVFYCMKYAIQQMLKQESGNIVNIASLAGLKASGKNLSYSASKFAVVGMTKSAALEYGSKNIRINAVCPGFTQSALLDKAIALEPKMFERLQMMTPMKRFGKAEEIAEAVVWLASDSTQFITGQTITLDGGISL